MSHEELAILTPTYRRDAELFAELHESVLRHTSEGTVHHVVVPDRDVDMFRRFAGPRCRLIRTSEVLPSRFRQLPKLNYWCNARRPWPIVRGWMTQQIVKLSVAGELDVERVILADSDVVLIRDVSETLTRADLGLFRSPGAVHSGMVRHVRWHEVARRLLGLSSEALPPLHDYISPLSVWQPSIVRQLQDRVRAATGVAWQDAVGRELHFSEFILYGVFVDEYLGPNEAAQTATRSDRCHCYWLTQPMLAADVGAFAAGVRPDDIAIMLSARSGTPAEVRRQVREQVESGAS